MLKIIKELSFYEFMSEYEDILQGVDHEGVEIIYNSMHDIFSDGVDDMTVRDYIRYQLQVATSKEVLNDYNILDDEDIKDMDADAIHEAIEEYLNNNTYLLGYYTDADDDIIYIFDEF